MRKRKIFIGCSSESIELAESAKQILEDEFEVTIWNESIYEKSVFKLNKSFLDSLLKASLKFDFGILIGTPDDQVIYRNNVVLNPRDNILFELGLFMGRLGISKSAFIVEETVNVLSDLKGITLSMFKKGNRKSFEDSVLKVKDYFLAQNILGSNFFPSTTLASGYFENLLKPVCTYIITNGGIEYEGSKFEDCKLEIIIPSRLNEDLNIQFEKLKKLRKTSDLEINTPGRPRKIQIDTVIENNKLVIVDFPTTLTALNHTIKNLLPESFSTMDEDYYSILEREIMRFEAQIKQIAIRHGFEDLIDYTHVES